MKVGTQSDKESQKPFKRQKKKGKNGSDPKALTGIREKMMCVRETIRRHGGWSKRRERNNERERLV